MRQFLKETGLEKAYIDANTAEIRKLFDITTRDDPVSATIQEAAMLYFKKVTEEVDDLSMLTRELLGGLHDDASESNQHNAMFNPHIMGDATRRQYAQQLHQLAMFLVRATVTHAPPQDPYKYGLGVKFRFTQEQQDSALELHRTVQHFLKHDGIRSQEDDMEDVIENLHNVATSVLFGEHQTEGSASWDSAWRRFFAFGNLDRHGRPAPAARVAIWLSRVKFIMKIVASHNIYTNSKSHADKGKIPINSDECAISSLYSLSFPTADQSVSAVSRLSRKTKQGMDPSVDE